MTPRLLLSCLWLALVPAWSAAAAEPAPPTPPPAEAGEELRPGDRLRFQIMEDAEAPVELVVGKDGQVDLPYLGAVAGAGKTIRLFAAEAKAALEQDYYVTATVRISLIDRPEKSSNRGRIFISGQVRRVGMVEIDKSEKNTAGKVILANGGLGDFADSRRIRIFRTNAAGAVETKVVDLREVLEKGRIDLDVPIYDGDLLVVDSKLVNW
jgi:protein involved in polysaccharide export with SLBB domain